MFIFLLFFSPLFKFDAVLDLGWYTLYKEYMNMHVSCHSKFIFCIHVRETVSPWHRQSLFASKPCILIHDWEGKLKGFWHCILNLKCRSKAVWLFSQTKYIKLLTIWKPYRKQQASLYDALYYNFFFWRCRLSFSEKRTEMQVNFHAEE